MVPDLSAQATLPPIPPLTSGGDAAEREILAYVLVLMCADDR
jgi:hypothetical protein